MQNNNRRRAMDALNRLLAIHYRSLPMYLVDADPWTHHGDERATAAVSDIVKSHREIVQRLAEEIQQRGGAIDTGEFPIEYTDLHFLALDFILRELLVALDRDIDGIRRCAAGLDEDRVARALAEEALGNAQGHRQTIQELVHSLASKA